LALQSEIDSDISTHASIADAHHSRYADSEAIAAINGDTDHGSTAQHDYFSGSHNDLSDVGTDDHHSRYTDSEAVAAVNAETSMSIDIAGDADSVDGQHLDQGVKTTDSPTFANVEVTSQFKAGDMTIEYNATEGSIDFNIV
jgi:hypothetical protein